MSVTLENVTRTVDGMATIRDVSLTLERGTLSVLLGPTLSGKTSIMRLLAGLDKPATGRVLVEGKDVTGADVRQRSVAMVYQQFINYPSLTVYENIASPLRVQGRPREEIDRRVHIDPPRQGGGTAQVGARQLTNVPQSFQADVNGTIAITYTSPEAAPTGGQDVLSAQDTQSTPTITDQDAYQFVIDPSGRV